MNQNFWTKSERIPPILVRLLARHKHGPPLSDEDISRSSGLPLALVYTISHSVDWSGIDLPTMHRFLSACQVDFENPRHMDRIDAYLRARPTWKYLRKSPLWNTFYEPLIRRYLTSKARRIET